MYVIHGKNDLSYIWKLNTTVCFSKFNKRILLKVQYHKMQRHNISLSTITIFFLVKKKLSPFFLKVNFNHFHQTISFTIVLEVNIDFWPIINNKDILYEFLITSIVFILIFPNCSPFSLVYTKMTTLRLL